LEKLKTKAEIVKRIKSIQFEKRQAATNMQIRKYLALEVEAITLLWVLKN
jgi:hypothetical protein